MSIVKVEGKRPTGFCKEPLEMLELLEGKPSRAVLRGLGGSNPTWLPGGGGGNVVSLLDTMRLTVLGQYVKGLIRLNQDWGTGIQKKLESVKWSLWHGHVDKALARLSDFKMLMDNFAETYPRFRQLDKAMEEFRTYIEKNRSFIPNYGERDRCGETISTTFVESTVNSVISKRFVKRQSLQWTKRGAHLLLQTRVKTLNNELL